MKANILIFCSLQMILLVTGNPILQRMQSQLYPLMNYQNNPCNCNQPYDQQPIAQNPSNNIHPLIQAITSQTPMTKPCQTGQISQLDKTMEQLLMNRVLANPTLRAILDPNSRGLKPEVQIQNQPPVCKEPAPNVVNNYIIVPADFLKENNTNMQFSEKDLIAKLINRLKENGGQNRNPQMMRPNTGRLNPKNSERTNSKSPSIKVAKEQAPRGRSNLADAPNNYENEFESDNKEEERDRRTVIDDDKENTEAQQQEEEPQQEPKQQSNKENKNPRTRNRRPPKGSEPPNNQKPPKADMSQKSNSGNGAQNTTLNISEILEALKKILPQTEKPSTTTAPTEKPVPTDKRSSKMNASPSRHKNPNNRNSNRPRNRNPRPNLLDKPMEDPVNNPTHYGPQEHRMVRNSRDEAFIQEFRDKYPEVPEGAVRHFLTYAKHYYPRQMSEQDYFTTTRRPHPNMHRHPAYPNHPRHTQYFEETTPYPERRNKHRKESKRPKEPKKQEKYEDDHQNVKNSTDNLPHNNTTVELAPTVMYIAPENDTVSNVEETEVLIKENEHVEDDLENTSEVTEEDEAIEKEESQSYTPELGSEDVVPTMYENGIYEDYYPIFIEDGGYLTSKEFDDLRSLHDDRFHYTTDKSMDLEPYLRETRRYETIDVSGSRPKVKLEEYKKKLDLESTVRDKDLLELEDTLSKPDQSPEHDQIHKSRKTLPILGDGEEAEFKTPPGLEIPDFETRKVSKNRSEYFKHYHSGILDKISTFSHAKSQGEVTPANDIKREASHQENVELFGQSKVVQYSKLDIEDDSKSQDDIGYTTEKTVLVYAKSLGNPEDFW